MRKEIGIFADFNSRKLMEVDNPHLLVYVHTDFFRSSSRVLVIGNFDVVPQYLDLENMRRIGFFKLGNVRDVCTGEVPPIFDDKLVIPAYGFYWLIE